VCKSRMSWRRNGGMPDSRSAFHSATLSTESNAELQRQASKNNTCRLSPGKVIDDVETVYN